MDPLMDAANYDRSQIADIIKVNGQSVVFPLASFVYLVFVNLDIAKATSTNADQPHRVRRSGDEDDLNADKNQFGWRCRCRSRRRTASRTTSWPGSASGASMLKDGSLDSRTRPLSARSNTSSRSTTPASSSPGIFAKKEQDKVEEFVNGAWG